MEGKCTEILRKCGKGKNPYKKSYNLLLIISHPTRVYHFHVEKEEGDAEEREEGNEREEDHQREEEIVKRINQNRSGAKAQDKGAKWGI